MQAILHRRGDARLVRAEERVGGCRSLAPRLPHRDGGGRSGAGSDREARRSGADRKPEQAPPADTGGAFGSQEALRACQLQDGRGQLRQRLGQGVDEVGELALVGIASARGS